MATTTISADVTSANSKLAQLLRTREEDEMLLQIGKRKPKSQSREGNKSLPGARTKWHAEPDFSYPTPLVDRPRTSTGSTSFHFSYISISKEAFPTLNGKHFYGAFGPRQAPGVEHSIYIERDGASEHATYIERDGAVEIRDLDHTISEAVESTAAGVVEEAPTETEAQLLGVQERIQGVRSLFTNISDDPFERQEFWAAVHRCEREPKRHNIVLTPGEPETWWNAFPKAQLLDPGFKKHALDVAARYQEHLALEAASSDRLPPFRADPYPCTKEQAGHVIQSAMGITGYDAFRPPFRFESGRGGRVQIRFVAELPHELSAQDRALVAQNFCDHLGSFSKDQSGKPTGMMYTAVIHAPDSHNDRRNYHLHIVAYDRPARFRPDDGMWDFEVQETYDHKGEMRTRYPYRQNKIGEVARKENAPDRTKAGRDFIPAMRAEFAKITNMVLAARRIERRLDPRSYTDMGIDRTPTDHLGTNAAALESVGVPTPVGKLNAIAIWDDAKRAIDDNARATDKLLRDAQTALMELSKSAVIALPSRQFLPLLNLVNERAELIANVAEDRRLIMTFDHTEAKAKSRAMRTRQTSIQYLGDIAAGRMPNATKSLTKLIRQRFAKAQAHIEKIDKMLEPDRPKLAAAAVDIWRREERIKEIDMVLGPIKEIVARLVEVEQAKAQTANLVDRGDAVERQAPIAAPAATPPALPAGSAGLSSVLITAPGILPPAATPIPAVADPVGQSAAASVKPSVSLPQLAAVDATDRVSRQPVNAPAATQLPAVETATPTAPALVPLAPITIDGHAIVQPTIDPRSGPLVSHDVSVPLPTPGGLAPLRATETVKPAAPVGAAAVSLDIPASGVGQAPMIQVSPAVDDDAGRVRQLYNEIESDDKKLDAATPSQLVQLAPEPFVAPTAIEPKNDKRKERADPTLSPEVDQNAPIKYINNAAELEAWDQLLDRISRERIPVQVGKAKDGTNIFSVAGLSSTDTALLGTTRLLKRTNNRLGAIRVHQNLEIERLIAWVQQQGIDPLNLDLNVETRRATLLEAPISVRTLWRNWCTHERVREVFVKESERRAELAKAKTLAPKAPAEPYSRSEEIAREERVKKAERFPPADRMQSREVANFIRLTQAGASRTQLQAAADLIAANTFAREQVFRFGDQLASVYNEMVNDAQLRRLREMQAQSGRGSSDRDGF